MKRCWTFALLLSILAAPAFAEVVIRRSGDRILAERAAPRAAAEVSPSGLFETSAEKGMVMTTQWFFPWVIDDGDPFGNTTFFSVRNDDSSGGDVHLEIRYFDEVFDLLTMQPLTLSENELVPVSVRTVGGLVTVPGALHRGLVRIETNGDVSTDVFQVDFGENFASGDRGFALADFCTNWRVRFLRFPGTTGGTALTFILNGPLGAAEVDPPTITGEVYSQSGAFINSFTVRTDRWVLELEALDLVIGGTEFGTIVLELDTIFFPSGLVMEKHSAFSKFSLGVAGICTDLPL